MALSAIIYMNDAPEPSRENRSVVFQVSDGVHSSNELTGTIYIRLVDDNPLVLSCGADVVGFTEGSSVVNLSQLLVLSDADSNHEVSMGRVFIENPEPGDAIGLVISGPLRVQLVNNTGVLIDGVGTAMQYQVRILHTSGS